jgi:hypothetical protein
MVEFFISITRPGISLLARPVTCAIPAMQLPVSCAAKWAGGVRSCNLNYSGIHSCVLVRRDIFSSKILRSQEKTLLAAKVGLIAVTTREACMRRYIL